MYVLSLYKWLNKDRHSPNILIAFMRLVAIDNATWSPSDKVDLRGQPTENGDCHMFGTTLESLASIIVLTFV